MNTFQYISHLSIGLTYLLIFVGGFVRIIGAGMVSINW